MDRETRYENLEKKILWNMILEECRKLKEQGRDLSKIVITCEKYR